MSPYGKCETKCYRESPDGGAPLAQGLRRSIIQPRKLRLVLAALAPASRSLLWLAALVAALLLATAPTAYAQDPPAGSLDKSFGTRGKVTIQLGTAQPSFSGPVSFATGVAVQADGKIVVAGSATNATDSTLDFAVTRLNTDGTADVTFSPELADFGDMAIAHGVILQSDGKIVVAGAACINFGLNCHFALARYDTNGFLDATFGVGGKVTTSFGGTNEVGYGLALETGGKIVVAGISECSTPPYSICVLVVLLSPNSHWRSICRTAPSMRRSVSAARSRPSSADVTFSPETSAMTRERTAWLFRRMGRSWRRAGLSAPRAWASASPATILTGASILASAVRIHLALDAQAGLRTPYRS